MQFPNYLVIYNTVEVHFNLWYKSKFDKIYHVVDMKDITWWHEDTNLCMSFAYTAHAHIHFVCVHCTCILKAFSYLFSLSLSLSLSLSDQGLHSFKSM